MRQLKIATLYDCPVPKKDLWYAKDLAALIYNWERKQYPKITDCVYEQRLARRIKQKYKEAKGEKTLIEILKIDYAEVKEKYKEKKTML